MPKADIPLHKYNDLEILSVDYTVLDYGSEDTDTEKGTSAMIDISKVSYKGRNVTKVLNAKTMTMLEEDIIEKGL